MIIDYVQAYGGSIAIASSFKAVSQDAATYWYGADAIRNTVLQLSDDLGIDYVNNYHLFDGVEGAVYLAEAALIQKLHPNRIGHGLTAINFCNLLDI